MPRSTSAMSCCSRMIDGRSGDDFYLARAWLAGFEAAYQQYGNPPKRGFHFDASDEQQP